MLTLPPCQFHCDTAFENHVLYAILFYNLFITIWCQVNKLIIYQYIYLSMYLFKYFWECRLAYMLCYLNPCGYRWLLYYMQFKLFRVCFKQGFKNYFAERTHDSWQAPLPRGNFVLLCCSLDRGCFKLDINLQSAITQTTNPMINPRLLFSPYMTILSKELPLHISIITLWNL